MDYENIILDKKDLVATLTLNRPEKLNALSTELLQEFSHALDDVQNDHEINVLILTGAGRAFSSGFDISPGPAARLVFDVQPTSVYRFIPSIPRYD